MVYFGTEEEQRVHLENEEKEKKQRKIDDKIRSREKARHARDSRANLDWDELDSEGTDLNG